MSCNLEINNNDASKQEHVESSSSTTKNITSSLPQCRDQLKPFYLRHHSVYGHQSGRIATYHELAIKLHDPHHVVFQDHVTKQNHYISTAMLPLATKLVASYPEALLSKNWHGSWVTWSCEVTWQSKTVISSIP